MIYSCVLYNLNEIELKKLVRMGIPPDLRGRVWSRMIGSAAKDKEPADYYQQLLVKAELPSNRSSIVQIEKDLHRTFPNNVVYEKEGSGIGMLRRILTAYSVRNPVVGYCQSLNFLVGLFLLFMDELEAFWMLAYLVEDLACITEKNEAGEKESIYYYQTDLAGIRIDQRVFRALVAEKMPKVSAKLDELRVPLEPLTVNWFLCMLVHTLPLEAVLRVWDCMYCEGIKVLFRATLGLLKSNEKLILRAKSMEQMMTFLRGFSHAALDIDEFIKVGYYLFYCTMIFIRYYNDDVVMVD
jgi:hypothetical protein